MKKGKMMENKIVQEIYINGEPDESNEIVRKELLPLMEDFYQDELMYFTSDEFENRIIIPQPETSENNSKTSKYTYTLERVSFEDLNQKFNEDKYCPVDGKLVRVADHISAFVEADSSIKFGITSTHLQQGRDNIKRSYEKKGSVNGINLSEFFALFE